VNYEEITYEGYGPGGVALMIESMTDNRNRTVAEIRHIFSKNGGNLGESGSVGWMFEKKGYIVVSKSAKSEEELFDLVIEAGADVTFVEAPQTKEEMRRIAALPVPQVANIVFGGKTPSMPQQVLADLGFSLVLYANAALQAALRASTEVLSALKRDGMLDQVADRLASFEERQRAVAKPRWDALEERYRVASL
jgi:hypothetical protein